MSKKYLSLEEAANQLSLAPVELMRMREQGEIRGFADRGNWKFKTEDVEALARSRSADSNPDVPLYVPEDEDDDLGEQPTIISKSVPDESVSILDDDDDAPLLSDSDSDVRLIGGAAVNFDDSDSDVKLVGMDSTDALKAHQAKTQKDVDALGTGSDSDVRLSADDDSDSDVSLMDSATITSFSMEDEDAQRGSDSDVKLVSDADDASDVTLMGANDDALPVELSDDESVLLDESGISLAGDSSLMLGGQSGISLEGPTDSGIELSSDDEDEGITLDLGEDSGITLEMDESGISLEADDVDSGISLEGDDFAGTMPMMDSLSDDDSADTQYEIPPLDDEGDVFNIAADETGVLDMGSLEDSAAEDAAFDLDEDEAAFSESASYEEEDLDFDEDDFDDDSDLGAFDADEDVFDEGDDESFVSGGGGGRMMAAEVEWGTGIFVGLACSSLLLILCGVVMIDLVGNMSTAANPNPLSSAILNALGGLYRG